MRTTVDDSNFRPMLAVPCANTKEIEYPVLMTPKFDGIRCITRTKQAPELFDSPAQVQAVSRYLLPIPNWHIQEKLSKVCPPGLDGELITYDTTGMKKYNPVQSDVMSGAGEPVFIFHVFDYVNSVEPYVHRAIKANEIVNQLNVDFVRFVPTCMVENEEQLVAYEARCISEGYEGAIYRSGHSPYKYGRSTWRQQWMIKLKRFKDSEATVIGFEELMHNDNGATTDERGYTKRSSHAVNLRPSGTLGALRCSWNGLEFNIGTGFDNDQRKDIWEHRDDYLMRLVKFKYQPYGQKEAPRSPVFIGFRSELDLDARPLFTSTEEGGD